MARIDQFELGTLPPRRLAWTMRLRTASSARSTFARLLRAYAIGDLDEATFKTLAYGMSQYLAFLKVETEGSLERRIDDLYKLVMEGRK